MSALPCVSDFRTPYDEVPKHAHCTGRINVELSGVNWIVDFDYNTPIVYVATTEFVPVVDITDCIPTMRDDIIEKAIAIHDED